MLRTLAQKWKRRPFPSSFYALKHCRISYSQYGEDLFLTHLLGYERNHGVYVDVGCFHPISWSNTYIFYQRGWRGYCIDANPDWSAEWSRSRPTDKFINAAIAPQPASMTYVRNKQYPAMNQLLAPGAYDEIRYPQDRFSAESVQAAPLGEVLGRAGAPREIDLLSIDCEEMDLSILQTLDFREYTPRVICVEDHNVTACSAVHELLQGRGYALRAMLGISKIFERT
ncbi:MAG: FkbM family methyltransferase [Gammaproteobacteria bacterium]